MAKSKVSVVVVNVVVHPHDPETYVRLFKSAFERTIRVKIHGERFGRITRLSGHHQPRSPSGKWHLQGTVATYINLDPSDTWFDDETGQAADPEDANRVPRNLRPTMREFDFEFSPYKHHIAMVASWPGAEITPPLVEKFWKRLFEKDELVAAFGPIRVKLIDERDKVEEIVSSCELTSIRIRVARPNPDDVADAASDLLSRLEEWQAESQELALVAQPNRALKLPNEIKTLARIAANGNGYVVAKEAGKPPVSTKDHPHVETETFDKKTEDTRSVFERIVASLLPRA